VTTVQYPLNDKLQKVASNGKTWGIYNKPLHSAHPGAVGVVFGDGHVAMLADTLELPVLLALASRNDRQPVAAP
jgi:prepilin-type processing-associated H-X9-DG protein